MVTQAPREIRETILVVEDDSAILNRVKLILERAGFEVLSAGLCQSSKIHHRGLSPAYSSTALRRNDAGCVRSRIGKSLEAGSPGHASDVDVWFR